MTSTNAADEWLVRVAAGEPLGGDAIRALAEGSDVLQLGMLADAARRRRHGRRATFSRLATVTAGAVGPIPPGAAEVEVTGEMTTLGAAVEAIAAVAAAAPGRVVLALSWADVERFGSEGPGVPEVLARLRAAGLGALAVLPLDHPGGLAAAVPALVAAGFDRNRLSVNRAPAAARVALFEEADRWQREHGGLTAIDPLPRQIDVLRPTTGYEDVKMVALARLAAPAIPTVQVDWRRYGPKLAQVALTFGADDLHGVSASDDAPEGRRRAPLEEIRRNIEAAGFEPVERDGRFEVRG